MLDVLYVQRSEHPRLSNWIMESFYGAPPVYKPPQRLHDWLTIPDAISLLITIQSIHPRGRFLAEVAGTGEDFYQVGTSSMTLK